MAQKIISEEFNHEVKTDKNFSQILIEISEPSKTLEEVKKIIGDLGVHIIEMNHLSPNRILLKLDIKDIREIALKLTENGLFNYAIVDGIFNLLYPDETALLGIRQDCLDDFQLCFDFGQKLRKLQ